MQNQLSRQVEFSFPEYFMITPWIVVLIFLLVFSYINCGSLSDIFPCCFQMQRRVLQIRSTNG